jgi:hypothetical protein
VPELVEKRRLGCKVIDENRISVDSISALEAALSMAKNGDW